MARILETEVMNDSASVDAYTQATLSGGIGACILNKLEQNNSSLSIADIGCGNCGYYEQLVSNFPNASFTGYEASSLMLQKAAIATRNKKVKLVNSFIPDLSLPTQSYDLVISSLFLHQLADPTSCWNTIKQLGKIGSKFAVLDLLRVEDSDACWDIVNGTVADASDVFKTDFYNTLRAAFTVEEIQQQLLDAGLIATIETQEIYPNCSVIYITGTL
jgi:ubiquinone/menaquinone biosynthesis C-methylase UbiE